MGEADDSSWRWQGAPGEVGAAEAEAERAEFGREDLAKVGTGAMEGDPRRNEEQVAA